MNLVNELVKKSLKKADVMLSVCSHRWFDIDAMASAMQLFANKRHSFYWCPVRGDALIDRARSRVASYFLQERQEDILFFVDDDVVFSDADAIKVIDDCLDGCDIVGGMYVQKKTLGKTAVFFDGQTVEFSKKAKPVEIEAMPTGFLAIHRRVLEGMVKANLVPFCHPQTLKFWPFFLPLTTQKNGQWVYVGEDWAFCHRARSIGFKVWLDPSLFLQHKGEYLYDLADQLREPKKSVHEIESLVLK